MPRSIFAFPSLFTATLLMLLGSGLLTTYLALRMAAEGAAGQAGWLMAAHYAGLVLGGKFGHLMISRVGHVRAYVAAGGMVSAAVIAHGLLPWLAAWLPLRFLIGLGMMTQFMVVESWLNEQAEPRKRGRVFSMYMTASYLGLVLGQLVLVVRPALGLEPLLLVALCFSLCLVPVATTRRIHPAPLKPAPLEPRFFLKRVPQSMTTVAMAGLAIGAFYGLGPVYAGAQGLETREVGLFMTTCVLAGLVVQAPLGRLSDRFDRSLLIRLIAVALALSVLPLGLLPRPPLALMLAVGFVVSLLLFALYPLAVALSNDHVEQERRVALSAMLLLVFGVGACLGPLIAGELMSRGVPRLLYLFIGACALVLVWRVRPQDVHGLHRVEEAPIQHVAVPVAMAGSPLSVALDPRVDEAVVQEQMQGGAAGAGSPPEQEDAAAVDTAAVDTTDVDTAAGDAATGESAGKGDDGISTQREAAS
ncbi:MFS transporter [Pseudomonas sp. AN-1]|uniref:MFS transporter n=1 Tax=Pseudomonas sp. AN-1 TaxID=3096605 RepID=UPI002A6AA792|nr:MFS transporter [Pseudomonas sp. AN-1]WPP47438.1 MFS transporter [Pseudomonas sp. AN-1]